MEKKWIQRFFIIIASAILMLTISFLFLANGWIDPFYLRFTTPRQSSLILGTSRAAQGMIPHVIDGKIYSGESNLYNFAFTGLHSPYGETYLRAIKKKVKDNSTEGLFLLEVSPSGLKYDADTNPENNQALYKETKLMLNKLNLFNSNPNLEYLFLYYEEPFYKMILNQINKPYTFLHEDGWLEVSFKTSEKERMARVQSKMDGYRQTFPLYQYSPHRIEALKKTIEFLDNYGKVILVRLPTSGDMYDLENQYFSDFSKRIEFLASSTEVPFIDLAPLSYECITTDGNHLRKDYSEKISRLLGEMLKTQKYTLSPEILWAFYDE